MDRGIKIEPLALVHPTLLSEHTTQNVLGVDVLQARILQGLRNRLTLTTIHKMSFLFIFVRGYLFVKSPDVRSLLNFDPITTRGAYAVLSSQLSDPYLLTIWKSRGPKKIVLLGWLLYLDKINTHANLHRR